MGRVKTAYFEELERRSTFENAPPEYVLSAYEIEEIKFELALEQVNEKLMAAADVDRLIEAHRSDDWTTMPLDEIDAIERQMMSE